MQNKFTAPIQADCTTLFDFPFDDDLENLQADIAILGLPFGMPYSMSEVSNDQCNAPTAIRRASTLAVESLHRWDFDLGGTLLDDKEIKVIDCGDITAQPENINGHYQKAETAVRKILAAGAMPICLGGDHGVPIPVFRAFENHGPIHLIQLDAHVDWRDHLNGVKEGFSSTIRRASEMSHVDQIYQIGLRCQGSARTEEINAALDYGANLITVHELNDSGIDSVLSKIPDGERYYLTIDADGLDPSIMPAVAGPAPGGVTYHQARKLIHGLVNKGTVVGMDLVEITPSRDINQISSITAGRLIANLIGSSVRAGYFES